MRLGASWRALVEHTIGAGLIGECWCACALDIHRIVSGFKSHQPLPGDAQSEAWLDWHGNSIVDELAKSAALMHDQPMVGLDVDIARYLEKLADWVGKLEEFRIERNVVDSDAPPSACPAAASMQGV
eukprot:990815-Amphidinium_carterae.1